MIPTASAHARRYDLDWLRVIAFAILIFYHIGMFYVTWDWHVKSPHEGPVAELPMMLVNTWRLSLLFFISGVVIRYAMDKAPLAGFAWRRFWRLFAPIVFGVAVVVMPQAYFELRYDGVIGPGILAFWPQYFSFDDHFGIVTPTWNHLWYIVYLLAYTMIAVALAPVLRPLADRLGRIGVRSGMILIALMPIPFLIYNFTLDDHFPHTHDFVNDWANHAHRFTIFMLGFTIAKNDGFWRAVDRVTPLALGFIAVTIPLFVAVSMGDNWQKVKALGLSDILNALRTIYACSVIISLCGLARRYLNRDGRILRYLTNAVFCFYILHQTIIVAAGYNLAKFELPWVAEFSLLILATVGGCFAGYEIFRRVPVLRFLMGIEDKDARLKPAAGLEAAALRSAAAVTDH